MNGSPVIYIVDDDAECRARIKTILGSAGIPTVAFASGWEFLAECDASACGCVILDMIMPGLDGMEVQREMKRRGLDWPVIFLTSHADVPTAVRSLENGAAGFLQKPCNPQELLGRVSRQLEAHREARAMGAGKRRFENRLNSLTPRERQVMTMMIDGLTSKQIGAQLGTSSRTVEVQRRQVMAKMHVDSLPRLTALAVQWGVVRIPSEALAAH